MGHCAGMGKRKYTRRKRKKDMTNPNRVVGVQVFINEIFALTASGGTYSLGDQRNGPCVYKTCRCRNLCKAGHCVGAVLEDNGYVVEDGTLVEITRQ